MNTRSRAVAAGVLLALGLLVIGQSSAAEVSSHSPSATDARFQPSGEGLPFDPGRYRDFDDYVLQTRERLQRHKVYMDPHRTGMEFAAAKPFERTPAAGCPPSARNRWSRGVLLLHGLSDMPLAMQDLANAFAARCFVVRTILLPGHGTRAGDLLDVTHGDWLAATRFGLETLKGDVDEVFVGGFSLGGLLAMHAVLEDATVSGAFLFSPALALESAWLIRQSLWLRHVLDWLDRDEPDDYARYEAMPVNAMAETFLLVRKFTQLLEQRRVHIPVFMSMSADDSVIDVAVNRDYFEDRFSHPGSRLVVYRRDPREGTDPNDARISYRNSFLPGQRIAGFSHLSVHIAPANAHYGTHGDYRNCGQASGERAEVVERCLDDAHPWRGEMFGDNRAGIPDGTPVARLTYNPHFDELLEQVDEFLTANSF
ncbi:MAG: alpha/beta fold hydrolase [Gammaproteobacteria bacterium]|nr:alpha/beta fold hydrolase [Gammaproteobacteria bacterium]MYG67718.1 alpha/beta fold hydrolase [Gammaproteobacteria bacterium]